MTNRVLPFALLASITSLFIFGCAESPYDDVHAVPRETKAWETVDLASFDQAQLVEHLQRLSRETNSATAAGEYVEYHHLEVAITATLDKLEPMVSANQEATETIAKIKPLAIKLHEAGHDSNIPMGTKLAAAIEDLIDRLANQL